MKKILSILLLFLSCLILNSCLKIGDIKSGDIAILYTNDVHCEIEDGNVSYASVSQLKKDILKKTNYVSLVDNGDAIQGGFISTISKGKYIIDLMNAASYDYLTLGNHEFDYGMDELKSRIDEFNGTVLSCNITYIGSNENKLENVKPYDIKTYGNKKVAYIGVTTPDSITSSTPSNFMEDGEYAYSFLSDDKYLYEIVQSYIDEVKELGADYVVVMSHLGEKKAQRPYDSKTLIQNTTGIDVVLDAHSHSVIRQDKIKDKDGHSVILSQTGTKFKYVGLLLIKENGRISTKLISRYDEEDKAVISKLSEIKSNYEDMLNTVIAYTNFSLKITDGLGVRMVRRRETNLGDLIADAYRIMLKADIGLQNGGGIREDIDKGDITYQDIYNVLPFSNTLCVVKATGKAIVDALEFSVKDVIKSAVLSEEFGGFLQVSGIKFTVDTSIESSVELDNRNMFKKVSGEYRVQDVYIINSDDTYTLIDLDKEYLVAGTRYVIFESGDGNTALIGSTEIIKDAGLDFEVVVEYIKSLENFDQYSESQKRIIII